MLYFCRFRWLLVYFLLKQSCAQNIEGVWPLPNPSSIALLGLFNDILSEFNSDTTIYSVHARCMFKAAVILAQRYNMTVGGEFIGWETAETYGNVIGALNATCNAVSTSTIIGIVGPILSRESYIIAPLGQTIGIPVISYGSSDPDLSDRNAYPAFFRTIPSDSTAILSLVKLFDRFNWTSCILIYQNDEFGAGAADAINRVFGINNLTVTDTVIFDTATLALRGDLQNTLSSSLSRIVLLWTEDLYTTSILQSAIESDVLGPHFTWILYASVSLNNFNESSYEKLLGMLSINNAVGSDVNMPTNTTLLGAAYNIWQQYEPESFPESGNADNYGLFSFDATWTLIQSLQRLCSSIVDNSSSCVPFVNTSLCFRLHFLNFNEFIDVISSTNFLGVSGPIQFSANVSDRINGAYYIIQNIQPTTNGITYVPVLKWSDTNAWEPYGAANLILWPGSSVQPPSGLPSLLGIKLRIGVLISAPFTMLSYVTNQSGQTTTNLIGYIPDLIQALQNKTGFIPDIQLAPLYQTYDGMIQAVVNGDYDIVVGDITATADRSMIVDFSSSIFDNSLRIIVRQPSSVNIALFAYLKPFSRNLWLALLGVWIYAGILTCLLERKNNEALKEKSVVSSSTMSMYYSFGTIIGYGADFNLQTAAGRLLTAGLYIVCMISVATYTANLASSLTVTRSQTIISGLDDIENGKIPFSRIGILVGSSLEDFYLREVSNGVRNFYPVYSRNDMYQFLLNATIDASIDDAGILEYETSTIFCNLTLAGTDFNPSAYGIVMPKQWPYAQTLDINILSLREAGTLDNLRATWFQGTVCPSSLIVADSSEMGLLPMGGLFLTFAIISVFALLLFAWTRRLIIKDYLRTLSHRTSSFPRGTKSNVNRPSVNDSEHGFQPAITSCEILSF